MSKATKSRTRRTKAPQLERKHVVWASLLAGMTGVGGLLLLLEDGPARAAAGGLPMVQVASNRHANLDPLFQTRNTLEESRWNGIVIHHSASPVGSAQTLTDQANARGFKGLGYHFVISNGQGSPDGQIFVGYRWQDQLPGVHVSGPKAEQYNRQTIGICLIGDGERREFTDAQVDRLVELVAALQTRLGIPDSAVVLHRDVAPTGAPGRHFPEIAFRQRLAGL
jgi:N-acetyl-anhydromuramyl-L-alanine amidase AmpD